MGSPSSRVLKVIFGHSPHLYIGVLFSHGPFFALRLCVANNRPGVSGTVFQKAMALGDCLEAGSLSYYSTPLIVWKIV